MTITVCHRSRWDCLTIARELTEAEQQIKDELEGVDKEASIMREQAEVVKMFQVVSGDMFSRITEPVFRVDTSSILFNTSCKLKLTAEFVEILFNPVERMIIVRPCEKDHTNALKWDGKPKGASSLCRVIYESMNWDSEYTYRVPCQIMPVMMSDNSVKRVLIFDLDNFIGKAVTKKDEIIIPRKPENDNTEKSADSQSFFFPPEDDDEPQELKVIAEQVRQELEINKKIFGTPVFKHTSAFRGIEGTWTGEEWFIQARSLDISHRVSDEVIDRLMTDIRHNPPKPKTGTIEVDPTNTEVN